MVMLVTQSRMRINEVHSTERAWLAIPLPLSALLTLSALLALIIELLSLIISTLLLLLLPFLLQS